MDLSAKISFLRSENRLTQEEFALRLGVSRQSVQKWESGSSQPTPEHLVKMAGEFNISLDGFLCEKSLRIAEETERDIKPVYSSLHGWQKYSAGLDVEYAQCLDEGLEVEKYKPYFDSVKSLPEGELREAAADIVFRLIRGCRTREGYGFYEPSDYINIVSCRPDSGRKAVKAPDKSTLKSKIEGAWYGRICGCLLGKPIEGIKRKELIPFLKKTGNYPMRRYILSGDVIDCESLGNKFVIRNNFADKLASAPSDDDTNYTVLYQKLIERYGVGFTPDEVSDFWLKMQPKDAYCTAERVAFCNFVNGYLPPDSAVRKNPYREWIGAQIRGDYFGYINPGDPAKAAEMAYRDACISHVKNGIYGEMFVAAMIAEAVVNDEITDIVRAGLDQIPEKSRLFTEISGMLDDYRSGTDYSTAINKITAKYNDESGHHWCHTVSNARIVTAALLYGEGDFGRSVGLAVQEGFDTDCNGATVGSVIGIMKGSEAIGECWKKPINGRLKTDIFGCETVTVEELVSKTLEHIEQNVPDKSDR